LDDGTVLRYRGSNFELSKPEPTGGQQYTFEVDLEPKQLSLSVKFPNGATSPKLNEVTR
jgi:hypothetical protein